VQQPGARSYSSELGRWTRRDPIGANGGPNLYSCVANSTFDFVDPVGLAFGTKAEWFRVGQTRIDKISQAYKRTWYGCVCECLSIPGYELGLLCEWREYYAEIVWRHLADREHKRDVVYWMPEDMINPALGVVLVLTPDFIQMPGQKPLLLFTGGEETITYEAKGSRLILTQGDGDLRGVPPDPTLCRLDSEGDVTYQDAVSALEVRTLEGKYAYD
jgi:hypothetical protein